MKKYFFLFKNTLLGLLEYRIEILTHLLMEGVGLSFSFFLWKTIIDESGNVGGYDLGRIIAYYILQKILWSINANKIAKSFEKKVRDGALSFTLLKPASPVLSIFSTEISKVISNFIFTVIVFAPIFIFYKPAEASLVITPFTIIWTLILLFFSLVFNYLFCFLFGCLAFWLTSLGGLRNSVFQVIGILRGAWFPLDIAPVWFQKFTAILPFSYLTYYPVKVLTSETTSVNNLKAVLILVAYSLVFAFTTKIIWKKGLLKYSAVGG